MVKLVRGGSVINGAYPVYFITGRAVWAWWRCEAVGGKGLVTHSIMEVFVEEFLASPVSAEHMMVGKSCV